MQIGKKRSRRIRYAQSEEGKGFLDRSSSGNKAIYFARFSSAVPSQLVPSIWDALHEGIARVTPRMAAIVSFPIPKMGAWAGDSDASPACVEDCCCCCGGGGGGGRGGRSVLNRLGPDRNTPCEWDVGARAGRGGPSLMKRPSLGSGRNTPDKVIQSCQRISSGASTVE